MRTSAREVEKMVGEEDMDETETTTENQLSGEDNVVNITLGTEPNAPLAYDMGLELHHLIMSKLGENIFQ